MTTPALKIAYRNLVELARLVGQLGSYAVMFVCAFVLPRAKTAATVVALSSQLAHRINRVHQKKEPKPRSIPASRLLSLVLSRFLEGWEDLAQLMKPATVTRATKRQELPHLQTASEASKWKPVGRVYGGSRPTTRAASRAGPWRRIWKKRPGDPAHPLAWAGIGMVLTSVQMEGRWRCRQGQC